MRFLVLAFFWGAVVATAAALVLQTLDQFVLRTPDTWSAAIVAPLTEEGAKGLFVLLLLWFRRRVIDGVLDGIVYAGLVGVGFAFTENILYLGGAYMGGAGVGPGGLGSATGLFVVRGIFSPFAHPLFTAFIGVGVGVAVVATTPGVEVPRPAPGVPRRCDRPRRPGTPPPSSAAGAAFVLTYVFAMVPAFLLLVGFAVWARQPRGPDADPLAHATARPAASSAPAEVPWLVRLPARRASRALARAVRRRRSRSG